MRPVTFKSRLDDDSTVEITGYPTGTPGLVVNESVAPGERCDHAQCWRASHARTGEALPFCWDSPEGALEFAGRVADICDWQEHTDAIRAVVAARSAEMTNIAASLGACVIYGGQRGSGALDNGVIS